MDQKGEMICAYLDILGFKQFIKEDLKGALTIIEDANNIIQQKMLDTEIMPRNSFITEYYNDIIERMGSDSFNYYLPFSDSIFIQSSKPNLLIKQISDFLIDLFLNVSFNYSFPNEEGELITRNIREYLYTRQGDIKQRDIKEYLFPPLFRKIWGQPLNSY